MSKLKIGFIGTGGMGQMAHLSNYAVLNDQCEVVAVAEPRPKLAQLVATRYGVPKVYENHLDLLQDAGVDAVIAAQPYQRHSIIIPDILRAGVPVFTEKPVALAVEAGEELVRIGEEKGVLHMIGYHKRSDPAMEYAKKVVDELKQSGELGQMKYVRMVMPPGDWVGGMDAPLFTDEPYVDAEWEPKPPGMTDEEAKSYDSFVNYYIHQVNAIRFMLGEPYRFTYGDKRGVLLIGESDSGVTTALEMAPYFTTHEWHESIQVDFENGFIKVELPPPLARQRAGKVTIYRDRSGEQPAYTIPVMPNRSAMRNQAMNFIAAVKGERPAPCVAKEAVEDLKIAREYIRYMSGNR